MNTKINNHTLHYNVEIQFDSNGKQLYQIIKEHFYLYLKNIKKENYEKVNQNLT